MSDWARQRVRVSDWARQSERLFIDGRNSSARVEGRARQ